MAESKEPHNKSAPVSEPPAESPSEIYRSRWGFWRPRQTSTGRLCVVMPWFLLLTRKLKFTIFELWIFIAAWSLSIGLILTQFRKTWLPWHAGVLLAYISFHVHCYAFTFILYFLSCSRGLFQEGSSQRITNIVTFQIAAALFCGLIAYCLRGI